MVIADPTLARSTSAPFCNADRFPRPPVTPGCTLPCPTLDERANGKVASLRGSFPVSTRSRTNYLVQFQCAEAYYSAPDLLKDGPGRSSHGVVTTENRFRWRDAVGQDSPGPIFNPPLDNRSNGGVFSRAERFPGKLSLPKSNVNTLAEARELMSWKYASTSNQSLDLSRRSYSKADCNFGARLENQFSPFRRAVTPVHSHAPDLDEEKRRIVGGSFSTAVRKLPSEVIAARDPTPGPGQFDIKTEPPKGFYIGRKVRTPKSIVPGPCSYDILAVEARLRRKRR